MYTRILSQKLSVPQYYARAIEAEIVKSVDLATHLITSSSWTATAKSLFAIVLQKPIVSMSWLPFIDETRPVVPIPKIEEYVLLASFSNFDLILLVVIFPLLIKSLIIGLKNQDLHCAKIFLFYSQMNLR